MILGCERDAIVDSTEASHGNAKLSNIKIEPIKEDILLQNKKVWDILKKINLEINEQNKNLYFQDLDFTINTNQGIYIEDGNYHSFTFPISRDSDNDLMENLLLSLQEDGSYKAFLVTYEITEEQRIALESNEELSNDLVISSIQELDDDFSDLFSKIIYQDGCVTMIQYEWHTWDGQTWQFTSGSTCNHLPDDPNGSCQVTYTYDIIDNCTSSAGGGPGSTNTGSSTYSPSGPSGGSTGGQNTTTPTPNCRANCITTLEQSTIVNVTGMEDGSSSYYWLVNSAPQSQINALYQYINDHTDLSGNLSEEELIIVILTIKALMEDSSLSFQEVFEQTLINYYQENPNEYLVVVDSPETPIVDMEEYLSCFDTNTSATVSLYADQPNPNNPNSDISIGDGVGHAFISISQGGYIVSYGFYPEIGIGWPNPTTGTMGNDQNHNFDVSVTIEVEGDTLQNLINHSVNFAESQYDLNDLNCTDFALTSGNILGFNIPESECTGMYPLGSGATPGMFGEHLRNMDLPNNATRNTNGGETPTNVNCP